MNTIILHRGNTSKGIENSLEAMNPEIHDLKELVKFIKGSGLGINSVFEVDIVTKYPFIVHHTTQDKVSDVFDILNTLDPLNQSSGSSYLIETKNKYVWELTEDDIKRCVHKNTSSKPMILRELLELAKENKTISGH